MPPRDAIGNNREDKNKSINLEDIKFEPYVSSSSDSAGSDNDTYSEDIIPVQLFLTIFTE